MKFVLNAVRKNPDSGILSNVYGVKSFIAKNVQMPSQNLKDIKNILIAALNVKNHDNKLKKLL